MVFEIILSYVPVFIFEITKIQMKETAIVSNLINFHLLVKTIIIH